MVIKFHIGIDNTDSIYGGCTTYVGALIIEELLKIKGINFIDYPNLIRLNPNIPWKTRGNGAIALRIEILNDEIIDIIKEKVVKKVFESSRIDEGAEPAVAFLRGEIPKILRNFSVDVIRRLVNLEETIRIAKESHVEFVTLEENKNKGIVGAVSAIGMTMEEDYTFELLAYRKKENYGKKRMVDEKSVYEMDRLTSPYTFNNIDYNERRILITPRGPDPVLFGIRGETPKILLAALKKLKIYEPIERWVIYRTNQGTDNHFKHTKDLMNIREYDSVKVCGTICTSPKIIQGGHTILTMTDGKNNIKCIIYEPTGHLRKIAYHLLPGDIIEVYGSVKKSGKEDLTINVEKIYIKKIAHIKEKVNPKCPTCNSTMKSEGKNKGYECKKCKYKANLVKIEVEKVRSIIEGLYMPTPKAQRHLTKPLIRYGQEKEKHQIKLIKNWYWSETIKCRE
ncbi:MAG: tRNA(Ile)(2)-agmatinylcytidine synthase [Candidatus Methanomethylicia archaeon]